MCIRDRDSDYPIGSSQDGVAERSTRRESDPLCATMPSETPRQAARIPRGVNLSIQHHGYTAEEWAGLTRAERKKVQEKLRRSDMTVSEQGRRPNGGSVLMLVFAGAV